MRFKGFTLIEFMIIVAIICILLAIALHVANFANMPVNESGGTIARKKYVAPYTTTTYNSVTKMNDTTYYDAEYKLLIDVDGERDYLHVPPILFDRVSIEEWVSVLYQKGRFYGGINIKSIQENI